MGRQPGGVDHRPAEEHEVEEALLEAVGEAREARQVLQDPDGVGDVVLRHPDPVGGAHQHVVLVAELLDVVRAHLARVAEQAVAVQRRPRRRVGRGASAGCCR